MKIHYLEIVSPDADELCRQFSQLHAINFSEPEPSLGNAKTAQIESGTLVGIRAPMHDGEKPVVRPYVLVDDINATVESANNNGAKVLVPPMELPGFGTCAIILQGGIESGFWQL